MSTCGVPECLRPGSLVPSKALRIKCICGNLQWHQGCLDACMRQNQTNTLFLPCAACGRTLEVYEDTAPAGSGNSWCDRLVLGTPLNPLRFPALGTTGFAAVMVRTMLWVLFITVIAIPSGALLSSSFGAWRESRISGMWVRTYELALNELGTTDLVNKSAVMEELTEAYNIAANFSWYNSTRDNFSPQSIGCNNQSLGWLVWFWIFCLVLRWVWWFFALTMGAVVWAGLPRHQRIQWAWWLWRDPPVHTVVARYQARLAPKMD